MEEGGREGGREGRKKEGRKKERKRIKRGVKGGRRQEGSEGEGGDRKGCGGLDTEVQRERGRV